MSMPRKADLLRNLARRANRQSYPDGRTALLLEQYDKDRRAFRDLIETKPKEAMIQSFLEEHPVVLLHAMLDGFYPVASTRCALYSKVRLGAEFEVDFAFCSANSMGLWWTLVEIERADVRLFTKAGDPTKELAHSIRQIQDWQSWISDHSEYASSKLARLAEPTLTYLGWFSGDLSVDGRFRRPCNSMIVIGRRMTLSVETNRRRRQMCSEAPNLQIVTYDRLFDDYWVDKGEKVDASKDQIRNVWEVEAAPNRRKRD